MSPKIRTLLSCAGIAFTAIGSICICLANAGCANPTPKGRIEFSGCLGDCTAPPSPADTR